MELFSVFYAAGSSWIVYEILESHYPMKQS